MYTYKIDLHGVHRESRIDDRGKRNHYDCERIGVGRVQFGDGSEQRNMMLVENCYCYYCCYCCCECDHCWCGIWDGAIGEFQSGARMGDRMMMMMMMGWSLPLVDVAVGSGERVSCFLFFVAFSGCFGREAKALKEKV